MEAPSSATRTKPRNEGVSPARCLRLSKASAIRLPPGRMSAMAAYGPSSRTKPTRRLVLLARGAAGLPMSTARVVAITRVVLRCADAPIGQQSIDPPARYSGDCRDRLQSRKLQAIAAPFDVPASISKGSDRRGSAGVGRSPPETDCVRGGLLVSCCSCRRVSERSACSWIQASWQRPQRGLDIEGCFSWERWASLDSPSYWLPHRWRSLSPRRIRTVQLRAWSRHEPLVMSSSSRARIGARVTVIKRRGNLILQIERFSRRWNQRAQRPRVSYPTRGTMRK